MIRMAKHVERLNKLRFEPLFFEVFYVARERCGVAADVNYCFFCQSCGKIKRFLFTAFSRRVKKRYVKGFV